MGNSLDSVKIDIIETDVELIKQDNYTFCKDVSIN